jgi:hypothetical protein
LQEELASSQKCSFYVVNVFTLVTSSSTAHSKEVKNVCPREMVWRKIFILGK